MKKFLNVIIFFLKQCWIELVHRHGLLRGLLRQIKFFLKRNKVQVIATLALLVMFSSGFYCAWTIQARRDDARALEQDRLITYLMAEQMRNTIVFRDVMILLLEWDDKIENLQFQLDRFYKGLERQYKHQEKIETPSN